MGEPTTTTGGKAIKYYADVRWKVWKINDKINELNKTTVDVIKNKLASPFGQAKINIVWGHGFDKLGEIIDYAVEFDFVKKGGAWFTYKEEKFQGIEKMKDYLEENFEELLELEAKVINKLKGVEEEEEEEEVAPTPEIEPVVTITDLANEY
jgi:recombination protein RecA